MKPFNLTLFTCAVGAAIALVGYMHAQPAPGADRDPGPQFTVQQESAGVSSSAAPAVADDSLLAQGRALYVSATYRCSVCHGDKGEGPARS